MQYPEQDKPIYLWDLRKDGTIIKSKIVNYKINSFYSDSYYFFKAESSNATRSLRGRQMNRFVNGRVGSFDGDDAKAMKIIEDTLVSRKQKYKEDYERVSKLLEQLRVNDAT